MAFPPRMGQTSRLMTSTSAYVLDVSRLISRAKRASPTGIDRVELKAAQHALSREDEVFFFATRGPQSWFPPREDIRRLCAALETRWTSGTPEGDAAAERLLAFLGAEGPGWEKSDPARRETSKLDGPRAPMSVYRARRSEAALAGWPGGVVYRNVSHHHLDKPDFLAGIKRRWRAEIDLYWHDAIPIAFPEYSREGDAEKHERRLQALLHHADRVEVNSRATRQELERYAGRRGLALPELRVEHLRPELPVDVPPLAGHRPFFMMVGTIEPRKNHRMILEVWRELAAEMGSRTPALVIAGRRGWMNTDTFALLDRCPIIQDHILEVAELPDVVLASALKSATALLMPSFAEGFGLPVVEAQALGTRVIASDLDVFREIAMQPLQTLSPLAGDAWKQAIRSCLGS